ncbi:MAG: hypothetical protein Q4C22_05830 [Bacillota bacterium]|nr:hypothetical protein [Bacillota bacterium]
MKQIIVMGSMLLLGVAIYNLIAGNGEGSVMESVAGLWEREIALRSGNP